MDWDKYFMSLVFFISMKSKDPSTQIGAVIVDNRNSIISTGYNGLPRGAKDNIESREERPEKYFWYEHAERNAIYNAPIRVIGMRMYTNGIPCMDCARAIIQAGLKEVIVDKYWDSLNSKKWKDHAKKSKSLFNECGIKLSFYDGDIITRVVSRKREEYWQPTRNSLYMID